MTSFYCYELIKKTKLMMQYFTYDFTMIHVLKYTYITIGLSTDKALLIEENGF